MDSFTAEDLSTIGGIATVSILHSFIPTHWLPFSIVGRAQKWTLSRTLLVTAFGAILHVISTSLLGITAITMANTIAGEETVHKLASLLLVFLGGMYIVLFLMGKGGHSHSHNQPMEKMAVAGLILVPALSPCATTLPVFLAVGNSSSMMVLAIIVLLFSTISVMTSLVALSFYGASQLKFHWVERYDKLLVGSVLCLVGVLTLIFHDHDHSHHHGFGDSNHDHDHGHSHHHGHGQSHHQCGGDSDHDHGTEELPKIIDEENLTMLSNGKRNMNVLNINIQGAYLHVMTDMIQSIGVMIAGGVIWAKPEWFMVDLLCTLIFSVLSLSTTLPMLRNIFGILMERTPSEINIIQLENGLRSIKGVQEVHDLHVWAITVGKLFLSCHVVAEPGISSIHLLDKIKHYCEDTYQIQHVTIQIE
jgi:cation diffusion facilitator family transporter